jgi:hyperosmotically inducible periplasmic protein
MRSLSLALALGAFVVIASQPARVAAQTAPDNTERNERDRGGDTLTPTDQGESDADREITRSIRKAVVAEDAFSVDAKNVKIITRDGVVTLRGPVETAEEKARIGSLASTPNGVRKVDNQIEVSRKD